MYCLFVVILLTAMGMAVSSMLSGLILVVAALLFFPPVNDWFEQKTGRVITPAIRFVGLVGLIMLSSTVLETQVKQENATREAKVAADDKKKAEQANQEQKAYLAAHRIQILADLNTKIASKSYQEAALLARQYQGLGDGEIDAASNIAIEGERSLLDQQNKAALITSIKTLKPNQYQELASAYRELSKLEPDNPKYAAEAQRLDKVMADQEATAKAKVAESQAREQKRSAGLLWNYVTNEDSMSGKVIKYAVVQSLNSVNFGFPYNGAQRGKLSLRKHPRWGESAYLSLDQGQFICGYDSCNVRVRYGNGKPQRVGASEPSDHSTNILFISNHKQFVANAKKVDKVYIEAEFYQEGNRVFEFDVSQLDW
ncbi:hypothetical protein PC358_04660 [Pseudomonas capeferrum]|nr:hypothetical protein PC358_04660 [Pseudomonas capeferrum]